MSKLLSMLGLARKAGKLKMGYDPSVESIRSGKAALAIAAGDISEKTYKNLAFEAERMGVPAIKLQATMQEINEAYGIRAGVMALTDSGFANAIEALSRG